MAQRFLSDVDEGAPKSIFDDFFYIVNSGFILFLIVLLLAGFIRYKDVRWIAVVILGSLVACVLAIGIWFYVSYWSGINHWILLALGILTWVIGAQIVEDKPWRTQEKKDKDRR